MHASDHALQILQSWLPFGMRYWWTPKGDARHGCWGTGYAHWGVQSHQKLVAALAVLADDPSIDAKAAGLSRDEALARALAGLRFTLDQHLEHGLPGPDGATWGHTWISALGVERMMPGVELLEAHLDEAYRAKLRAVLCSEADYQLTVNVGGDVWGHTSKNKPESNIWNGALCARAALCYPEHPRAAAWIEKAHEWLLNGISIPADAQDDSVVAGKPLKEWHRGPNFFPHYSLDHHMYLNVGYMVICISNLAILHYAFKARRAAPPESLYHHAEALWSVIRKFTFADGRLCRIGGDSRVRYCYCQDYLLPALYWAADHLRDPHAWGLLEGQLKLIEHEQKLSGDGGFISRRMEHMKRDNELYYTRLESDKASGLALVRTWWRRFPFEPAKPAREFEATVQGGWSEPEHGAVFHRSPTRIASFAWRASEGPMGLCLAPDNGHDAEWQKNLAGGIRFLGETEPKGDVHEKHLESFPGGFVTSGVMSDKLKKFIGEGWRSEEHWLKHKLVFAALPDERTVLRLEFAALEPRRVYLDAVEGVKWEIPNDILTGRRTYAFAGGERTLEPRLGANEVIGLGSAWVNVDGRLGAVGIYGADTWSIARRGTRIGGYSGSMLTDALCWPCRAGREAVEGPATLLDSGVALFASTGAAATKTYHEQGLAKRLEAPGLLRAILALGFDGRQYVLAANFGAEPVAATLAAPLGNWIDLAGGRTLSAEQGLDVQLEPNRAKLFLREGRSGA
ncbi:MAG: hypothetical protein M5U26_22755 [Planctomycetota bacterium]|nr:hypothetical protein [Planctomycetota bacterium]